MNYVCHFDIRFSIVNNFDTKIDFTFALLNSQFHKLIPFARSLPFFNTYCAPPCMSDCDCKSALVLLCALQCIKCSLANTHNKNKTIKIQNEYFPCSVSNTRLSTLHSTFLRLFFQLFVLKAIKIEMIFNHWKYIYQRTKLTYNESIVRVIVHQENKSRIHA